MKLLLSALLVFLAAVGRAAEHPHALAPIAELVGATWRADVAVPKGSPRLQLEAHFEWAETGQAIRFTSTWIQDGKKSPYTSGFYAWNAARRKVAIFYTDAQGSLTEGSAHLENGVLVHELSVAENDGKITPVQTRLTHKAGGDSWTNEIFVQKEGSWVPFVTVRYVRSPE